MTCRARTGRVQRRPSESAHRQLAVVKLPRRVRVLAFAGIVAVVGFAIQLTV